MGPPPRPRSRVSRATAACRRIPPRPAARPTRAKLPCPYRARPRPKCVRVTRPQAPSDAALLELSRAPAGFRRIPPDSAGFRRIPPPGRREPSYPAHTAPAHARNASAPPAPSTLRGPRTPLVHCTARTESRPCRIPPYAVCAVTQVRCLFLVAPGVAPPQSTTHSRTGTGLAL